MNAIVQRKEMSLGEVTEQELVGVLQNSIYPGAKLTSIALVISYCKAQRLDPLQKPVHIVPMWDKDTQSMRDVIMPGVNLYRTQAARSGQYAGVSEPEFGPDVTEKIGGEEITYPNWCKVIVRRRLESGEICEFVAREFWKENYAQKGGKDKSIAPNAMWKKRPYGQIAKCAQAQALRLAFPEIGGAYTAEEMEGKVLNEDAVVVDQRPSTGARAACKDALLSLPIEEQDRIRDMAMEVVARSENIESAHAYIEEQGLDPDQKVAIWSLFDSKLRSALKKHAESIKNAAA